MAFPGQHDSGYAEAGASAGVVIRVKNGNNVLYTSSKVSVSASDSTDDGQSTTHWTTDSGTIASKSLTVYLPQGNVDIEIVASYIVSASATDDNYEHASGAATAEITVDVGTIVITGIDKYCVMAKDGIAVIANSNSAFYVKNDTQDKLQLIAKGLPTSSTNLSEGQIYRDGNTLKIKTS